MNRTLSTPFAIRHELCCDAPATLRTIGNLCSITSGLKAGSAGGLHPAKPVGWLEGGTRLKQIGLFEMRRLEALSNTIFGVAMTLLAYDLPKASRFANAPAWMDLVHAYAQPVIALVISFIVAGVFWLSHHRRLTFAPEGSRGEVFLNLIFLLSIRHFTACIGSIASSQQATASI